MVDMCRMRAGPGTAEERKRAVEGTTREECLRLLARTATWGWFRKSEDPTDPNTHKVGGSGTLIKGSWGQGVLTAGTACGRQKADTR